MNLKAFIFLSAALLVWILESKVYMLLYYLGVLLALVSFLNTRAKYKLQPYKWINLLFFLYVLFIVWERTRHYKFSEIAELVINDAEHIFFANIISLLIALMLTLTLPNLKSYFKLIVTTVIIFNTVGVINEYFQNLIGGRALWMLIPDSKKDLLMNVIGTVFFVLLAWLYPHPLNGAKDIILD